MFGPSPARVSRFMPSNYNIQGYASMIHDARRVDAYRRALQQMVTPESVVVDIGTGLGIFAMLACQAGARKVYAIEPSSAITLAGAMAAANGYSERIEFIQDVSSRVTLPEPADVIVSDIGGAIPLFQQHIPTIADARTRLLKPGGTLIPRCDTLWAAVVEAAECYAKIAPSDRPSGWICGWPGAWPPIFPTTVSPAKVRLLSAPERLAILDYTRIDDANLRTRIEWDVMHRGRGHGICVWFERTLADGICYSTAPGEPEMVYSPFFSPGSSRWNWIRAIESRWISERICTTPTTCLVGTPRWRMRAGSDTHSVNLNSWEKRDRQPNCANSPRHMSPS